MQFVKLKTKREIKKVFRGFSGTIALDCETDSLDPRTANLKTIVLGLSNTAYSVNLKHLSLLTFLKDCSLILQNFKYDFEVLKRHGLDLYKSNFRDTMLMHHLIDENAEHGLDSMVKYHFGDNYKEVFWGKYKSYDEAPEQEKLEYECKDGIYTYRLHEMFNKILADKELLVTQVHEFARSLALTELDGVSVDVNHILSLMPDMSKEITDIGESLRPLVSAHCDNWELNSWVEELALRKTDKGKLGVKKPIFNFASSQQVQWLLYDALKLPEINKTKAGKPSTDYDTLSELEHLHPVVKQLKTYKGKKTLYTTFVEGILERQQHGRIYPVFSINGTHTGRISSSNPNLQNLPKDGPYRGFFIPSIQRSFFGADYAQLEVVIEANLSGDKNLAKIILDGASKHDITANELKISRGRAKILNFAMQYWCSPYKVSLLMDCSREEGQKIYDRYWEIYKGVKELKQYTDKRVDDGLPVVSPFGRERHLPSRFETKGEENRAKRQAYNALIQGTGADLTHGAFSKTASRLLSRGYGRALWPVHDEILCEAEDKYIEEEKLSLINDMVEMGNVIGFKLPLSAKAYGPLARWSKT